jgi:hypothetical protein
MRTRSEMRCLYINREGASERRMWLEGHFAQLAPAGWTLHRVAGVDAVGLPPAHSQLTTAERGCWEGHYSALAATADDADDVMIVEDDVRFAPQAFDILPQMLAASEFDIIFSDVMPTDIRLVVGLARKWPRLHSANQFQIQTLAGADFTCAAAYLVRGPSKGRVLALLDSPACRSLPIDIALAHLIGRGEIRGGVAFPFLTAPNPHANISSIQPDRTHRRDMAFLAYRRLMFAGRDVEACREELSTLERALDDEHARLVGKVLGAMTSERFDDAY